LCADINELLFVLIAFALMEIQLSMIARSSGAAAFSFNGIELKSN
jgi:hypothetical protein